MQKYKYLTGLWDVVCEITRDCQLDNGATKNPVVNSVSVRLGKANINLEVSILDLHGRTISTELFSNSKLVSLNTEGLSTGSYIVKIKGDSFTSSSILVKK